MEDAVFFTTREGVHHVLVDDPTNPRYYKPVITEDGEEFFEEIENPHAGEPIPPDDNAVVASSTEVEVATVNEIPQGELGHEAEELDESGSKALEVTVTDVTGILGHPMTKTTWTMGERAFSVVTYREGTGRAETSRFSFDTLHKEAYAYLSTNGGSNERHRAWARRRMKTREELLSMGFEIGSTV